MINLENKVFNIYIYIFIFIIVLILNQSAVAQNRIFFNGRDITEEIETLERKGELLIKARDLEEMLDAELKWQSAIKTLEMKSDGVKIKLMADSPYIQIGNKALKTKAGLVLMDGSAFVPLARSIEAFGFLLEFQRGKEELYIFKPETTIDNVCWSEDGNQLKIEMDEITPYRVLKGENEKEIIVEIDKAEIAKGFTDNISNDNFYLKIDNVPDNALLRLTVKSKYPIPFQLDGGVHEEEEGLVLSFLPQIKTISWSDKDMLMVEANGEIFKPDIMYLEEPRRMVIDIPNLMLGDYKLNLPENEWVKDVRVSQFKYDPVTLRIVLELKGEKILQPLSREKEDLLVFKPTVQTEINNLVYSGRKIKFNSTSSLVPDMFLLSEPPRLVINLFNAERGENISDSVEIENDSLIEKIRTARFDQQTVRFVADLKELTGYSWEEEKTNDGYSYTVSFKNKFSSISSKEVDGFQYININLTGNAEYEVKKFNYPHRLVVDIKNAVDNLEDIELPEYGSMIRDIRTSRFDKDGKEVIRLVFELNKYYNHEITKTEQGRRINIALAKDQSFVNPTRKDRIVVDAGHGGFDPGAIGKSGLEEKEVNLAIALHLAQMLRDSGQDVILTRDGDEFISLKQRVSKANKSGAALFVSIHANSFNDPQSSGTETYYSRAKSEKSRKLAEYLQQELETGMDLLGRGVKEENLYVIKYTQMPAVLVETAFLSNPHEESLLSEDMFRKKAARAIYRGIIKYMNTISKGGDNL
ncbi:MULTISPECIES: N-acetylmuramoyl-L-alanine amidase family protein [unclassified Halanaerobium]|uniref:N-acetylmuramoyl-L-alanine amidase family protein n=1 Tax=unclassified Halanaerobium TaxID=2641197 RepID=UPI000E1AC3C2|nr:MULTISPECIES: N-acetylmuramoyl-L-alanine amidase family protein [unclassified Halanaerobium]RCW41829.1 N-acetylmuramoyl-L-alanine amidase [Halanaerobium sp. MA284_MarDTE_T2]RCW88017.1 N-acetylmuramoyl-L-alanine amidase [Halanaerobium sp. DL-01]